MIRLGWILIVLSAVLVVLNLAGVAQSLRPPAAASGEAFLFEEDLSLGFETAYHQLQRRSDQSDSDYVQHAVIVLSQAIGHGWPVDQAKAYHLTIPLTENYLLWVLAHIGPSIQSLTGVPFGDVYQNYEFYDWRKALERGVGLCSQHAIILDGVLKRAGIESRIVRLEGHVLNEVTLRDLNEVWLADGDYGLTIPMALSAAEQDTSRVRSYYEAVISEEILLDELARVYAPGGNELLSSARDYLGLPYMLIERTSYLLKWLLPLLMACIGGLLVRRATSQQ